MKPGISAMQAQELSREFLGIAQAIGDFRYKHWASLSRKQSDRLARIQWKVLQDGEDILAAGATSAVKEVEWSVQQLAAVTARLKTSLQSLKNIDKAIRLAGAVAGLGSAVLAGKPEAITKALKLIG